MLLLYYTGGKLFESGRKSKIFGRTRIQVNRNCLVNFIISPQNECFWGYTRLSLSDPSIRPCVCLSVRQHVYKISVFFCVVISPYSFVAIVWKLCRYIDRVLKFDKIQFSNIYPIWFKDCLSLNLENCC